MLLRLYKTILKHILKKYTYVLLSSHQHRYRTTKTRVSQIAVIDEKIILNNIGTHHATQCRYYSMMS